MKAIVVRQPWAALIALGVKSIETRPSPPNGPMRPEGVRGLPGCTLERGERIAIVAGSARPAIQHETHWVGIDDPTSPLIEANEAPWLWTEYEDGTGGSWRWWSGPLGAVVCTVVVSDAVEVVAYRNKPGRPNTHANAYLVDCPHDGDMAHQRGGLWLIGQSINTGTPTRLADQMPLGDFTSGRWGWLLTDVRECEPIPCKGRQGVFELPDDVASQIGAQ